MNILERLSKKGDKITFYYDERTETINRNICLYQS
ncbi:hypothetical protein SAMN04488128_105495 [Chitinophaga eiseniae]|uniref:YD repeat-containing protein n=1 Tax=Chitinophaga eiseniae TaxID=634771 RepID=A0A1T4TMI6_9BACT|nr:hypothetical protein SAMN04488128_105495 [Chitinophaga eiseniae]